MHYLAEKTAPYWRDQAKASIDQVKQIKDNIHQAKNVIIFVGDGMGISTITPSRILKGQLQGSSGEETKLVFEDFPNTCLIKVSKNYSNDQINHYNQFFGKVINCLIVLNLKKCLKLIIHLFLDL